MTIKFWIHSAHPDSVTPMRGDKTDGVPRMIQNGGLLTAYFCLISSNDCPVTCIVMVLSEHARCLRISTTPSLPRKLNHEQLNYCFLLTGCRIPNCETCLDRGYCTSCTPPFVSHRGQCIEGCPPGMFYSELAQECLFQGKPE